MPYHSLIIAAARMPSHDDCPLGMCPLAVNLISDMDRYSIVTFNACQIESRLIQIIR